ncbi:MAG TPA: TfuA-like protein [Thermoanaerobaculia bacterium]|nr:TfuA-like protein [Thermoanaerobaculia bacterium]
MVETGRVIVFAGPTLPRQPDAAWRRILGACDVRPPAQRGDVLRALVDRPAALVLIDGYYYSVPAVTHKELLYALDSGVRVLGAASLGALRAAELAPLGMTGVGWVFEQYHSGALDGDDEVAILHAAAELGYRGLTLALVELRFALERMGGDSAAFLARVKELPFSRRHPDVIAGLARQTLGEEQAAELMGRLPRESIKREDARLAIETALGMGEAPACRRRESGGFLTFYKEIYLPLHPAWRIVQVLHPEAAAFVRQCRMRSLLASAALRAGIEPPPERIRRIAAALERVHRRAAGGLLFPEPEYDEEARVVALARAACRRLGGGRGALEDLGRRFGAPPEGEAEEDLLALTAHPDLTPGWWLARAFSFTPALATAQEAAARAADLHACFERWAAGSRVARADLRRLAAGLWGCPPGEAEEEGRRRGLFETPNLAGGLWGALERVAAAESLHQPINTYPAARAALLTVPLAPPLGLPSQPGATVLGPRMKGDENDRNLD